MALWILWYSDHVNLIECGANHRRHVPSFILFDRLIPAQGSTMKDSSPAMRIKVGLAALFGVLIATAMAISVEVPRPPNGVARVSRSENFDRGWKFSKGDVAGAEASEV